MLDVTSKMSSNGSLIQGQGGGRGHLLLGTSGRGYGRGDLLDLLWGREGEGGEDHSDMRLAQCNFECSQCIF